MAQGHQPLDLVRPLILDEAQADSIPRNELHLVVDEAAVLLVLELNRSDLVVEVNLVYHHLSFGGITHFAHFVQFTIAELGHDRV